MEQVDNFSNAQNWRLQKFPRRPFGHLRMGFPKLRETFGALPKGALLQESVGADALGPNDVRLRVEAVTLNFRDYAIALGLYAPEQPLPVTLGSDALAIVCETGRDVTAWSSGDRAVTHYIQDWQDGAGSAEVQARTLGAPLDGVLASHITIPEHGLVAAPRSLDAVEASTLPIAGLTAWSALTRTAQARPGETVLVQGSGGVSLSAIQIAKALELTVIATTGSPNKADRLRKIGADHVVITSHKADWSKEVKRLSGGGVDIVLDVGGGATMTASARSLTHGGRVICIGFLGGVSPKLPVGDLILKNGSVHGVTVGHRADFEQLCAFVDTHNIKPVIDSVFDFDDAPQAFERLASGRQFGNICIRGPKTETEHTAKDH